MKSFMMTKTVHQEPARRARHAHVSEEEADFTPITRGKVEIDINKCIFCGMCARRCPTDAIVVTKDCKEWQIDRLKCCTCNLCVEICPVKCLRMENQYSPIVSDKDEAIYTTRAGGDRAACPARDPEGEGMPGT